MALRALHFAFGLAPLAVVAQQPFPTYTDNGTWSVLLCLYGTGLTCVTQTFTYDGSETFCGHTWSVYAWPTFGMDPGIAYFRNDGQRTLLRRTTDCLDKEYVIYDFSMEAGDTVYAALNMDLLAVDTAMFVLQSIDMVEQFGIERRRFHMLYDRCDLGAVDTPMDWIEGIGSTTHPFFSVDCMCAFCQESLTLLCYDSAGVQLYVDPEYNTCDTMVVTGIGTQDGAANVHIIYDPLAEVINVNELESLADSNSGLALVLLASDGRVVKQQDLPGCSTARIDVSSVAPGAYAVVVTDGRTRLAGQRVVIQ